MEWQGNSQRGTSVQRWLVIDFKTIFVFSSLFLTFFVEIGQAVAGIFSTLVDMFITGLHVKPQNIGVICFIIAMTVLLLCMIGFNAAFKSEFFQYYLNR